MNQPRRAIFVRPRLDVSGADRLVVDAAIALQSRGWQADVAVNFFNPAWTQPEVTSGQVRVTAYGGIPGWSAAGRMRALSALASQWLLLRRLRRRVPAPDLFVCDVLPHAASAIRRWFPASAVLVYCHFPDRLAVAARGPYGAYRAAIGRQEDRGMMAAHRLLVNSSYTADAVRRTFPFLPEDRLAIVRPGARLPEVRALVEHLQAQAAAHGLAAQVELRFDPSHDALEKLWREAFALVHCAPAEHFGIVPIEAMARGLPVLAVDNAGPRETVADGITGALRPPVAGEFAEVLVNWSRAPAHAAALGAAGRARAEREFSLDRLSAEFATQAEMALLARASS